MDYERFQATAIFSKDLRSIQPSEMWFYLRFLGITTTRGTLLPLRAAQDCIQPQNKPQLQLHTAFHLTKKITQTRAQKSSAIPEGHLHGSPQIIKFLTPPKQTFD